MRASVKVSIVLTIFPGNCEPMAAQTTSFYDATREGSERFGYFLDAANAPGFKREESRKELDKWCFRRVINKFKKHLQNLNSFSKYSH